MRRRLLERRCRTSERRWSGLRDAAPALGHATSAVGHASPDLPTLPNATINMCVSAPAEATQYNRCVRRILICMVFALLGARQTRAESTTVLVFPFENATNDRRLDWLSE